MSIARRRASCWWTVSFPRCEARPNGRRGGGRRGFREIGLPFETDTAVTRHLAAFSAGARRAGRDRCGPRTCCSTAACSRPPRCAQRLLEVLGEWFGGAAAPQMLGGRARPGPCRGPRGGLLWLGQARRRHAHPRRHRPGVLRGHRNGRPGRARRAAAAAGAVRGADRHGRRDRDRRALATRSAWWWASRPHFRFFSSPCARAIAPAICSIAGAR